MSEFIVQDIKLLVSKTIEATFNELKDDGTDFYAVEMRGNTFGLPSLDKTDNSDLIGSGSEFASVLRPNYWNHPVLSIGEAANTDLMPLFLARAFGGVNAAPATVNVAGKQHTLLLGTTTERQLPSMNVITSVGYVDDTHAGADFQWTGVVAENFQISQNRAEEPSWSTELVGSGNYVTPVDADVRADLPSVVGIDTTNHKLLYTHGAAVVIQYTDGSTINLATEGRIRSWSFQLNNNLRREDRRPGDPFRTANDPTSGAYVNRILRGRRNCSAQVVVALDEDLEEFITMSQNRIVDNLTFIMKGNLITGATPATNQTIQINIPKAYLRATTPTVENDDAAITLDWFPIKGTGEYVSASIINTNATAYA